MRANTDAMAAVGKYKAYDLTFNNVIVSDGVLNLDLLRRAGSPAVNAIEIVSQPSSAVAPTITPTRTPSPTMPAGSALYRVNASGDAVTDAQGNVWSADQAYTAGSWGYVGGVSGRTTVAIANTDDDALYQSERWWEGGTGTYKFTLANGVYDVELKFAETYYNSFRGSRVFDIKVEGQLVRSGLDIAGTGGSEHGSGHHGVERRRQRWCAADRLGAAQRLAEDQCHPRVNAVNAAFWRMCLHGTAWTRVQAVLALQYEKVRPDPKKLDSGPPICYHVIGYVTDVILFLVVGEPTNWRKPVAEKRRDIKSATIYDVAERAAVSTITVSRVVNRSAPVADETRARVQRAIAELNFVPNAAASNLRAKKPDAIALLIPAITNPFWSTIAHSVQEYFTKRNVSVFLGSCSVNPGTMLKQLHMALAQGIDGIIMSPVGSDTNVCEQVKAKKLPCVVLDHCSQEGFDCVYGDSVGGATVLTGLLIERGHVRIALVNGPRKHPSALGRFEGYERALRKAGLQIDEQLVHWGPYDMDHGAEACRELLALSEPPTAIFAANNWLAAGTLNVLNAQGIVVPGTIAVVGFDEWPPLSSFLTVAAQPAAEMGKVAAEFLSERMRGYDGEPRERVLPVELRVRLSSGQYLRQPVLVP